MGRNHHTDQGAGSVAPAVVFLLMWLLAAGLAYGALEMSAELRRRSVSGIAVLTLEPLVWMFIALFAGGSIAGLVSIEFMIRGPGGFAKGQVDGPDPRDAQLLTLGRLASYAFAAVALVAAGVGVNTYAAYTREAFVWHAPFGGRSVVPYATIETLEQHRLGSRRTLTYVPRRHGGELVLNPKVMDLLVSMSESEAGEVRALIRKAQVTSPPETTAPQT